MKLTITTLFLLLFSYAYSQNASKVFGGSQDDRGEVIIECANTDIIIGGVTTSFGSGGEDIIITRLTPGGQIIWSKAYGLSGDENDGPLDLFETNNGDILCSFRSTSLNQTLAGIAMRLDFMGNIIWQKQIGVSGGSYEATRGIFEHDDGNIYVGNTLNGTLFGSSDGMLTKLDPNGNLIWSKVIGVGANDHIWSILPLPNGEVMLNMNSQQLGPGNRSTVFVKMDAAGNVLSQVAFGGAGIDYMNNIEFDPNVGYVVTGGTTSYGQGNRDAFIAKFDLNFNLEWFKTYGGPNYDHGSTVEIVNSNHFIMYMNSNLTIPNDKQMSIVGVDGNGTTLYTKSIGDQFNQEVDLNSFQALFYSQNQNKTFLTNSYNNSSNNSNILFQVIDGTPDIFCMDTIISEGFHTPSVTPINFSIGDLGYSNNVNMNTTIITNLIEEDVCLCPISPPNLSDTTLCSGTTLQYNLDPSYNYEWQPASAFSCTTCPDPIFIENNTTPVTVIMDNSVCSDTVNFTITFEQETIINLSGPDTICESVSPITLGSNISQGIWSGNGITDTQNGIFDPIGLSGNVDVYFTPQNVCTTEDTLVIFVEEMVIANILDSADTLCFNQISDTLLSFNAVPSTGYWSGNAITDSVNGYLDEAYMNTGQITVIYTPYGQCAQSDSLKLEIIEEVTSQINFVDTLCQFDDELTLTESNGFEGIWSGNGITDTQNGIFDPSLANTDDNIIIFNAGNQCIFNDTISVYVKPTIIIADILTEDTTLCLDENPLLLQANPSNGSWSGFTASTNNGNTFFDPASNGTGNYTILYTPYESCALLDSIMILVDTFTTSSFTLADFCEGNPNAASDISVPGGIFSFNPAVSDGATINSSNGEIINGVEGTTYSVQYTPPNA